jgi:tRNA pseudouridine32 synthase/23S rRNA pseudouridine746 synthase
LCVKAAEEVQQYLQTRTDWHEELQQGKMFGVLVVKTPTGEVGYLAAFSGNLAGSNHHDYFVPPVYDLLNPDGYFKEEEAWISAINVMLNHTNDNNQEIIEALKEERKQRSIALQQWIFEQFRLRNARGEEQDIYSIFTQTAHRNPPAGTGECAAPKLLQYAYLNNLQPLAMAEFWWGDSPKGEIRRHGHYYPACRHKCEPILNFMLQGLEVEPNPLLTSNTDATQLETVYEDDFLLVVNKPAGMLSVPGKTGQASVLTLLQERYPDATGPILVHRLDMATSGLLLAAKDKDTHALLQKQFEGRTVKKRYIALLEGIPQAEPKGFIRLPLRPDFDNRPLQMVCYEYGKPAVTRYEIMDTENDRTRMAFYPETGRTHQLRVHAAHPEGLNCPIVGDPLYGQPAERLYLHAERLEFRHPVTGQRLQIQKEAPF